MRFYSKNDNHYFIYDAPFKTDKAKALHSVKQYTVTTKANQSDRNKTTLRKSLTRRCKLSV